MNDTFVEIYFATGLNDIQNLPRENLTTVFKNINNRFLNQ